MPSQDSPKGATLSYHECGKSFSISTYLVLHYRTQTRRNPINAKSVETTFVAAAGLYSIIDLTQVKPYNYQECGKSFSFSSSLIFITEATQERIPISVEKLSF